MASLQRHWPKLALAALLLQSGWMMYPHARNLVLPPEHTAYESGKRTAARLGCFGCHGPDGRGGVPNPGSVWETVPAFTERVPMMFAKHEGELREYVLDGAPASKRDDGKYEAEMAAQALRMPAYRGRITDAELDDVIAFIRAASGLLYPEDDEAGRGMDLALTNGCFGCHGDMGGGGVANPGSLKGYIPGFWGEDFKELVRNDEELLEWINEGRIARLTENPIANEFIEGQTIQMPAYKDHLTEKQVRAVAAAVRWMAGGTWQDEPLLD
jgi:mono/diheme cytochrome c family protein